MFWTGGTDTNFWALGLEWEKESEDGKGKRKRLQLAVLENDNGDRSLARSLADFLPSFLPFVHSNIPNKLQRRPRSALLLRGAVAWQTGHFRPNAAVV